MMKEIFSYWSTAVSLTFTRYSILYSLMPSLHSAELFIFWGGDQPLKIARQIKQLFSSFTSSSLFSSPRFNSFSISSPFLSEACLLQGLPVKVLETVGFDAASTASASDYRSFISSFFTLKIGRTLPLPKACYQQLLLAFVSLLPFP